MDTLNTALGMVRKNCYMASIDLTDAYYSVPVATVDQKYLMFQFEGIRYKYVCLPNGLSPAPRIFTKLMKPVLSSLRKKGTKLLITWMTSSWWVILLKSAKMQSSIHVIYLLN